jgi:hypothetical protein
MAIYSSIQQFRYDCPSQHTAIQCVFVSDAGEIHQWIISESDWHVEIKNLMTRYVYVNNWKSIVHTIHIV